MEKLNPSFNKVYVGYGEVFSVEHEDEIYTQGLYSCLGVALLDNQRVAMVHLPIVDYWFVDGRYASFQDVMDVVCNYFDQIVNTKAHIVGGLIGLTEPLIDKVKNDLLRRGCLDKNINQLGPHNTHEMWNISIIRGQLNVVTRIYRNDSGENST